jgi:preprotein translocase subunit SecG
MTTLLVILGIVVSACMGFLILIQNPKGGGINPTFGGFNQVLGAKKSTDVVERTTWYFAGALLVLCLFFAFIRSDGPVATQGGDEVDKALKENMAVPSIPSTPIEQNP